MERESFIVYKSFYGLIKLLPEADRLRMFESIFEYGFTGIEPEIVGDTSQAIWAAIRPQLNANYKRWSNGIKGGAPKGNQNARKTTEDGTEKTTEKQPNENVNVNVNDIYAAKEEKNVFINNAREDVAYILGHSRTFEDTYRDKINYPSSYQGKYITDEVFKTLESMQLQLAKEVSGYQFNLIVERIVKLFNKGDEPTNLEAYIKAILDEE